MSETAPDYIARAERHRPLDRERMAAEICRLAAEGWTEHGIGLALRLDPAAVRHALADAQR